MTKHIIQTKAKKPGHTKTPSMSIQVETKDASIMAHTFSKQL